MENYEDSCGYDFSRNRLRRTIKQLRKAQNLTQVEAAKKAGVSRITIINAEKGTAKLETMYKIRNNIQPVSTKFPWIKKVMLGVSLMAASVGYSQKQLALDGTIGMTAGLRPAAIVRGLVSNGKTEIGIGLMYPSAITCHLGHRINNVTPYIGLGSEAWMLGLKWHVYNAIAVDASITSQTFRLTFGYSFFK